MVPLLLERSWLYVYDREMNDNMLHIPFGGYLVLRDDIYHGGFYDTPGNIRMQITLLHKNYFDSFAYLLHANPRITERRGLFEPLAVNYQKT